MSLSFYLTERLNDTDGLEPVPCQPWTSRLPKMAQPDLDYIGKLITNENFKRQNLNFQPSVPFPWVLKLVVGS